MKKCIFCFAVILLPMLFFSCNGNENIDDSPAPALVTITGYDKTNGGAIIHYELPDDKNLLFVQAEYTNSLNKEVSKVSSRYDNKIAIGGFNDLDPHVITLYSVGRNGKKSAAQTTTIVPDTSYIELIKRSLTFEPILGGVRADWYTPASETVFLYIDYDDGENEYQRIISNSRGDSVSVNVRGLDSIPYRFHVTVEDLSGNRTERADKGEHKPRPELKIDKSTWRVLANLSANGTSGDGRTENFIDDVVDTRELPSDNSYFIINRSNNGGTLEFFSEQTVSSGGKPLMMVVDMGKEIMLSRFVCWQRAFDYSTRENDGDGNSLGFSREYAYYKDDNLKSFLFYATNNLSDITVANVWENPLVYCDFGGPYTDGFIPASKIAEAIDGHEYELPGAVGPFRYFVMAITGTYGSETQVCFSEISLYGTYVQ